MPRRYVPVALFLVLVPVLHVGLGQVEQVDVRVRFPSGMVREVRGAKAGTTVEVREE